MTTSKRIWVIGSSGLIGRSVVEALGRLSEIEEIVGLDKEAPDTPGNHHFIQHNICTPFPDVWRKRPPDVVVQLAFRLRPSRQRQTNACVNIEGGRNVLRACRACPPRHLIWMSSATVYGFSKENPVPLTEACSLRTNQFSYAVDKCLIEKEVEAFAKEHPEVTVTILRPSMVVGSGGNNPFFDHLRQLLILYPKDAEPLQFTHVRDLAEIVRLLVQKEKGGVYNVGADGTVAFSEMVERLGRRRQALPGWLFRGGNTLAWNLGVTFLGPTEPAALGMFRYPWVVCSERLKNALKFEYGYTSAQAFEDFANYERLSRLKDRRY